MHNGLMYTYIHLYIEREERGAAGEEKEKKKVKENVASSVTNHVRGVMNVVMNILCVTI